MTELEIFTLNTLKNNDFYTLLTLVPQIRKTLAEKGYSVILVSLYYQINRKFQKRFNQELKSLTDILGE